MSFPAHLHPLAGPILTGQEVCGCTAPRWWGRGHRSWSEMRLWRLLCTTSTSTSLAKSALSKLSTRVVLRRTFREFFVCDAPCILASQIQFLVLLRSLAGLRVRAVVTRSCAVLLRHSDSMDTAGWYDYFCDVLTTWFSPTSLACPSVLHFVPFMLRKMYHQGDRGLGSACTPGAGGGLSRSH